MTKAERERATQYVRENYTFIVLHTLYLQWGLPTTLLKPLAPTKSASLRAPEGAQP